MILKTTLLLAAVAALGAETYTLGPDSQPKPGVPKGTVTQHRFESSRIFPGTVRDYWVYTPANLDESKPLPVMIFQDGSGFARETGAFHAPVVMDNLIAEKSIPPMLGIFIDPGVMPAPNANAEARYNRSYEYDGLGDRYARFLIEEILPEVSKTHKISSDPNDRGLCGSSSGGIAAFTAAWSRPDAFRRVISFVGSYTNLKGGNQYASWVRKMEPKPLRIFLQDGYNDQNIYSGNWWIANQDLASALEYAGYENTFVYGSEGHNGKHGSAILPYAMRWLWAGYPQPIAHHERKVERHYVSEILDPSSDWELVSEGHSFTEGPAVDKVGNLYFVDVQKSAIYRVDSTGKKTTFAEDTGKVSGLAFAADGKLYAAGQRGIATFDAKGKATKVAEGIAANDLAVSAKGNVYFSDPAGHKVWFVNAAPGSKPRELITEGLFFPNGVRLSADESLLLVSDTNTRTVWSWQIQPDGSVANGQPFYRLELPEEPNRQHGLAALADGMTVDTEGFLYVATAMGVQVCDQPGRVVAILRPPDTATLSNVTFGGPYRSTLYATGGDKVWKRKLRRTGLLPGIPVKPPKPRL